MESGTLRITCPHLATVAIVAAVASLCLSHAAAAQPAARVAQKMATSTEESGMFAAANTDSSVGGCGCNNVQRPPWHSNVHGGPSGSACGTECKTGCGGVVFQAKPCHQLHLRSYAHAHGMTMPSCFPRLHTWCTEGHMPTPPSPSMPRCHQCGAVVEGGF